MSKLRTDSWGASLTEEQVWKLYYKSRGLRWDEVAEWAAKEFGVEAPSRAAFYRFIARMRKEESAHRLEQVAIANAEAEAIAKQQTSDEAFIAACKSLATNLTLAPGNGNAKEALRLVQMATALSDRRLKAEELRLKAAAQGTRDEQLRLAREKFEAAEKRLKAVQEAVRTAKANGGGLSAETLKTIEEAAGLL